VLLLRGNRLGLHLHRAPHFEALARNAGRVAGKPGHVGARMITLDAIRSHIRAIAIGIRRELGVQIQDNTVRRGGRILYRCLVALWLWRILCLRDRREPDEEKKAEAEDLHIGPSFDLINL
jgi:hypothetical protein